jgi:hypothetical protein
MLPRHVINVAVLPQGTLADDIVVAHVRPDELVELLRPLSLQPWHPDTAAWRVLQQVPLGLQEHLHLWPMRSSSSAPSGIGGMAYPTAEMCHPWGRCHAGGTRIAFSHSTLASASVKLVGREKPPPVWAIVRRARERWAKGGRRRELGSGGWRGEATPFTGGGTDAH